MKLFRNRQVAWLGILAVHVLSLISCFGALNVVATLPDFGALAQAVGGTAIKVTVLARGTEDAHFVDARPSFIRQLNQADLLLEGGLELEGGWLPPLVNNARNRKILPGGSGLVQLSKSLRLIDAASGSVDRSMGDVHPGGNPHYWLDPANGKIMVATILEALQRTDAANATEFAKRAEKLIQSIDLGIAKWDQAMLPLKGTKVISYHRSYDYFLRRYGLELVATLEPKPGIEPSPSHLSHLIERHRSTGVKWLLIEPFRPLKTAEYVATAIGARVIILPDKVGADSASGEYLALFERMTALLTAEKTP